MKPTNKKFLHSSISLWEQVLWSFIFSGNDPEKPDVLQTRELPELTIPEISWRCGAPSQGSLRSAVFQLKREGAVRSTVSMQGLKYRLTPEGKDRLSARFPFARGMIRKWDKSWRIILFKEVHGRPLAERSADYKLLRRIIKRDGFGALGKGLFLSAAPPSPELLTALQTPRLATLADLFETKGPVFGDAEVWLHQAYDLDTLNKQYAKFGGKAEQVLRTYARKKTLTLQEKKSIATLFGEYLALVDQNPVIPEEYQSRWPNIGFAHDLVRQLCLRARLRERQSPQE